MECVLNPGRWAKDAINKCRHKEEETIYLNKKSPRIIRFFAAPGSGEAIEAQLSLSLYTSNTTPTERGRHKSLGRLIARRGDYLKLHNCGGGAKFMIKTTRPLEDRVESDRTTVNITVYAF